MTEPNRVGVGVGPMPTGPKRGESLPPPGKVWLVGAGPGDPELLTLKAVRVIGAATVLLVDDLVADAVLAFADPAARIVRVGKRGGCRSTPQAFIDKLMATEALRGERVVRLKGGDPFVFGRGGEEAEGLRAQGIEVEVVNGITAGLAAATALGVPLTHRAHAHGVMFVTGHARDDGAALQWPVLAAAAAQGLTLVIYMGVTAIEPLQAGLLQALPASTPAAVVQHASLAHERRLVCTLGSLVDEVRAHGLGSPAIVIVGDVVRGAACLGGVGRLRDAGEVRLGASAAAAVLTSSAASSAASSVASSAASSVAASASSWAAASLAA